MCRILEYIAGNETSPRRVRDVIREDFGLVAHDVAAAKYRTENGITVNGEVSLVNRVLFPGDVLRVKLADRPSGKIVPAPGPLDILYEDQDLIALNKPAGLVVHPSHGHFADTLGNFLAQYYLDKNEPHEVRTVGRLDKDTSGVIIYGKSRTACAHLVDQAVGGRRKKWYIALAGGVFGQKTGMIDAPISREYEEKIKRVVRADGAPAMTHYRVLAQLEDYAVLLVTIDTGRTHQIRVHMAYIGHPLLGDPIYGRAAGDESDFRGEEASGNRKKIIDGDAAGGGAAFPDEAGSGIEIPHRAALHAWRTSFYTPFERRRITVTAPLPEDMKALIPDGALKYADIFTMKEDG